MHQCTKSVVAYRIKGVPSQRRSGVSVSSAPEFVAHLEAGEAKADKDGLRGITAWTVSFDVSNRCTPVTCALVVCAKSYALSLGRIL